jgi:hypothetical protein
MSAPSRIPLRQRFAPDPARSAALAQQGLEFGARGPLLIDQLGHLVDPLLCLVQRRRNPGLGLRAVGVKKKFASQPVRVPKMPTPTTMTPTPSARPGVPTGWVSP